ncbi:unnamed protein product [Gongylonema pulchrum]|uniref:Uncharacterized protein n=1 Tax=Gongylonema pulchrum TaxID=637853 RepID=A0A183DNX2_9BILA|nr:unnamed protein product [Gongylonema pulchrum]
MAVSTRLASPFLLKSLCDAPARRSVEVKLLFGIKCLHFSLSSAAAVKDQLSNTLVARVELMFSADAVTNRELPENNNCNIARIFIIHLRNRMPKRSFELHLRQALGRIKDICSVVALLLTGEASVLNLCKDKPHPYAD